MKVDGKWVRKDKFTTDKWCKCKNSLRCDQWPLCSSWPCRICETCIDFPHCDFTEEEFSDMIDPKHQKGDIESKGDSSNYDDEINEVNNRVDALEDRVGKIEENIPCDGEDVYSSNKHKSSHEKYKSPKEGIYTHRSTDSVRSSCSRSNKSKKADLKPKCSLCAFVADACAKKK